MGEEADFLRRFGIAVEIVPGVTAACAAAAAVWFPPDPPRPGAQGGLRHRAGRGRRDGRRLAAWRRS
ncbi:SAM-dependent methyltransferase [Caulobacter sp. B11]|uniref:SAM-dependent methyltransferase n=1 Tax=Caulobacter sp. B11 TaxID=2048899 RepID=UPI002100E1AD|nr:SAM-dependent methyltransferase [Caulobacter sp. B11]